MIKTTVYLPEPLKRQLQRLAKRGGSSEAQLIRDAVERFVQERPTPRPRCPLFASNDPDLAERVDEALAGFGE
ncbi:MAG: ribbon-helix-helix domain-containing protein [Actinomycetota bacterium]|nr:ribbon-helix-helix domain-containing protein [Actinomycetota bacterium]